MGLCRFAVLGGGLLMAAMFANAASRDNLIQIKVLDSETRSISLETNGVPKNCDGVNFDAYCHNTNEATVTNTLLVQEEHGPSYRVACTVDSKWSRCTPLPKGTTFQARKEKRGIVVYYVDDEGKARSQLYTLVAGARGVSAASSAATPPQPAATPTPAATTPSPTAAAPVSGSTAAVPAANPALEAGPTTASPKETVKCRFSSTPAGAEVVVDGRYVGSTPSVLGITTGEHVVVISMAGFAEWKRQVAVTGGSELTVNAVLQKAQ